MRLNQITVPSLDLEKSIPFYENLGLELIVKSLPHYARFVCLDGESTFSIHKVDKLPSGDGIYVYFECDDLDRKIDALVSAGYSFDELPTDKSWLWREARLKDFDGNQLIFYHAGQNRLYPPWRIQN